MEVGYLEAWTLWYNGDRELPSRVLGGLEIYWWARIGKVAGLMAAMLIVVEIIGLDRLRSCANALAPLRSRTNALGPVRRFVQLYSIDDLDSTTEKERVGCWTLAIAASAYIALAALLLLGYSLLSPFKARCALLGLLVIPALGMLVILSHVLPVLILLLVGVLSKVLGHRQLARILNVAALLALLFAFHFEMLAS